MKSFSSFITEERKKGGRTGNMKFPGDDAYRKMQDELSEREKAKNKPKPVKQSEVSQQAKDYRTAQGEKRYQAAKTDVETRRGFQTGKGGLKADESNPYVNREVRQARAAKQGIPDPFKSKTPAPSDPFKGINKSTKLGSPSIPDPFKGTKVFKTKKTGAPDRSALKQAISDIKGVRNRLGITKAPKAPTPKAPTPKAPTPKAPTPKAPTPTPKAPTPTPTPKAPTPTPKASTLKAPTTVPQTDTNKYIRMMQDQGRPVDPDLVGAQGLKASGAKPEMVGGKTAPDSSISRTRARVDAARDISKTKNADLDKALKNLVSSGNPKKSKPRGPSTSIGFRQSSRKFGEIAKQIKADQARSAASGYSQSNKPKPGSQVVKAKPTGVGGSSANPGNITLAGPSKSKPSFSASAKGSELAKKTFGQFSVDTKGGGLAKNNNIIDVDVKVDAPAAAAKNAPLTQAGLNKTLRRIGGRALGVAGAGYDTYTNYKDYKKSGDSDKRAGAKSLFRTGLGYAGGALGGLAGAIGGGGIGSAVLGTAGAIGGYSAGTSLADWVLGQTRYERKKKARQKTAAGTK